jgi:hypothetical protein
VTGYFKGGEIITVELYKMSRPEGAYGAFSTGRIPREVDFRVGDASVKSRSSIVFWQDSYFVKLISLGQRDETAKAMDSIAKTISARIGAHSKVPDPVRIVPQKDIIVESLRLVDGPIGLSRYFQFEPPGIFDDKDAFGDAAVANYKDEKGEEFSYLLVRYESEWQASRVLDKIVNALKQNSIAHYYLFNVLSYDTKNSHFQVNGIGNYISVIRSKDKDFKYEWYLERVTRRIEGKEKF